MNIVIVGDLSSTNLGDPIICESVEYLVKDITGIKSSNIKLFDIVNRKKAKEISFDIKAFDNEVIVADKASKSYKKTNIKVFCKWLKRDKKEFDYAFKSQLSRSDENLIVIAGGALISRSLLYALRLNRIVKLSKRFNARVIFNAVGCEWFDKMDLPHRIIKKTLSENTVTHCSTRDNVEVLARLTTNRRFQKQIPDGGLYAADAYDIQKKQSDTVGIGIISFRAYKSVSMDEKTVIGMSTIDLFEFWHSIIEKLEEKGEKWKLFTNGGIDDYKMASQFLDYYGYSKEEKLMQLPQSPKELVEQISEFKSICAHRLHALIISTSLGIKCVPILWSKKVKRFAEMINAKCYWPKKQYAVEIVEQLDAEVDVKSISILKEQSKDFLRKAIDNEM